MLCLSGFEQYCLLLSITVNVFVSVQVCILSGWENNSFAENDIQVNEFNPLVVVLGLGSVRILMSLWQYSVTERIRLNIYSM